MQISLAQISVRQSDIAQNLEKGAQYIKEASRQGSQIICFPEMWTTGFHFEKNKTLCTSQNNTLEQIQTLCKEHNIWHSGSLLLPDAQGNPTNAHLLIDNNGTVMARYNKIHLFSFMKEDEHVSSGNEIISHKTPFGTVGLTVCYDIRFCELYRTLALRGASLILTPAAFPSPRLEHWTTLTKARAIENQLFMAATNQVGTEDFSFLGAGEITYVGNSALYDPFGNTILSAGSSAELLLTAEINLNDSISLQSTMHVLKDRRPDLYTLS